MTNEPKGRVPESIIMVGVGIVIEPETDQNPNSIPRILITLRKHGTLFSGYWELPGGKIEPGESPSECIVRELLEEIGILAEAVSPLDVVEHTYPHGRVRLHPWLCNMRADSPAPRPLHVQECRWCPVDRFDEHRFLPANERIMRAVRELLLKSRPVHAPKG